MDRFASWWFTWLANLQQYALDILANVKNVDFGIFE